MPTDLGPSTGQSLYEDLAINSLSHQTHSDLPFSLLQSLMRSPLYRRKDSIYTHVGGE